MQERKLNLQRAKKKKTQRWMMIWKATLKWRHRTQRIQS